MRTIEMPAVKFRRTIFAGLLLFCCLAWGCATMPNQPVARVTHTQGPSIQDAQLARYDGPKARIAVGDFQVKAAQGTIAIGDGLREMMVTGLFNTNRFIVLERQAIQDVILEQDFGASGRVRAGTAAPIGMIEGAELLVYGAVSEFEAQSSGTGIGIGLYGVPMTFGGGVKNAEMAIDLRVIDAVSGRVVLATRVEGKASDYQGNLTTVIGGGSTRMPISLGSYSNTPMEKAIRVCVEKAIEYVCSQTPQQYFHYR